MSMNGYCPTIRPWGTVCKCGWINNCLFTYNIYYTPFTGITFIEVRSINYCPFTFNINCSTTGTITWDTVIIKIGIWNVSIRTGYKYCTTTTSICGTFGSTKLEITVNYVCTSTCNINGSTTISCTTFGDIWSINHGPPSIQINCSTIGSGTFIQCGILDSCIITEYIYVPTSYSITIIKVRLLNDSVFTINSNSSTPTIRS